MTDWEPATEAEAALRDALRTGDQERYFQILSRVDLLLPVSQDVLAGRAQAGWGTWTTGGRTHILAFTSPQAMTACLAEQAGSARRMPYHDLAAAWPNEDWWLAINPGLPIEGYLPAWFVTQLNRGDIRLPGRTIGARARVEAAAAARARGAATVPPLPSAPLGGRQALPTPPVSPQSGAQQSGAQQSGAHHAPETGPSRSDTGLGRQDRLSRTDPGFGRPDSAGRARVPAHAAPDPQPEREPRKLTVIPPRALPPPSGQSGNNPGGASGNRPSALPAGPPRSSVPPATGLTRASDPLPSRPRRSADPPGPSRPSDPLGSSRPSDPLGSSRPSDPFGSGRPMDPLGPSRPSDPLGSGQPPEPPLSRPSQPAPSMRPHELLRPQETPNAPEPAPETDLPSGWGRFGGPVVPAAPQPLPGIPGTSTPPPRPLPDAPSSSSWDLPGRDLPTRPIPRASDPGGPIVWAAESGRPAARPFSDISRSAEPDRFETSRGETGRSETGRDETWGASAGLVRPAAAEPAVSNPAGTSRFFDAEHTETLPPTSRETLPPTSREPLPPTSRESLPTANRESLPATGHRPIPARTDVDSNGETTWPQLGRTEPTWSKAEPTWPRAEPTWPRTEPTWPRTESTWLETTESGPETSSTRAETSARMETSARTETPFSRAETSASRLADDAALSPRADAETIEVAAEPAPAEPASVGSMATEPETPAELAIDIDPDFEPANDVETELLAAAGGGQTDQFLSTLLLAKVLIPIPAGMSTSIKPGEPGFIWRREQVEGQPYVVVFTSTERINEYLGADVDTVSVKFVQLIAAWPDDTWAFAVNPGTPVGATLPGAQIKALATWATEVGLTDQPSVEYEEASAIAVGTAVVPANRPVVMQKPIAPSQITYYLERGYDRVSGFVQRASEVAHLTTPEQLYQALGLGYAGSPFKQSHEEVYVLRWTAHRPNLYRIPYGGRDEHSMQAMQGWVIERAPFRGNGFAPGESGEVIAEFKVDSARLPHAAQMWRMTRDAGETLVALLDADVPRWRRVDGSDDDTDDTDDTTADS